jgi:mevalonate kinase
MVRNTDNYNQIIEKLIKDFEDGEINGIEYFRKMKKICAAARARSDEDSKYDKVVDEIDKITKDLDHLFKKESKKIKDILRNE